MTKKAFIGCLTPRIEYEPVQGSQPEPIFVQPGKQVTLLLEKPFLNQNDIQIKVGDAIEAGQNIVVFNNGPEYVTSPVSGTVAMIEARLGDLGKQMTAVTIDVADEKSSASPQEALKQGPTLDTAIELLANVPGKPDLAIFKESPGEIERIVVTGVDADLLVDVRRQVIEKEPQALKEGIDILKKITGLNQVTVVIAEAQKNATANLAVEVKQVSAIYPSALPAMIMKDALGQVLPAGQSPESQGVFFISAEAVIALAKAFQGGTAPTQKLISVIDKKGNRALITADIGTHIGDIFAGQKINVNDRDRVFVGGPFTGTAVYSLDHPVMPDTDALMVQDASDIADINDIACINCGDCVRICPTKVPVNVLIRFLQAMQYDEAADRYDLHACIECGLCAYVCTSKIPIFQYIRLAKSELERTLAAEAENDELQ